MYAPAALSSLARSGSTRLTLLVTFFALSLGTRAPQLLHEMKPELPLPPLDLPRLFLFFVMWLLGCAPGACLKGWGRAASQEAGRSARLNVVSRRGAPARMNVLVAGFITIDRIDLNQRQITSIGGPPSYAGLLCARFGFDVTPLTKVGPDFPEEQVVWLARNGLALREVDRSSTKKTTRFRLVVKGEERSLYLVERCEDLSMAQVPDRQFNASLISPLAHEVSTPLFEEVRKRSDFTFLDPQGFVRMFDKSGKVYVDRWSDENVLGNVDALKMDLEEAYALTGTSDGKAALAKLSKKVRKAVVTRGSEPALVLDGNKIAQVEVPKVKVVDSTGAGDIFAGALISSFLRSRDFLWSCCFGIAASSLSLTSIALGKIELPRSVDQQAKRLYASSTVVETV